MMAVIGTVATPVIGYIIYGQLNEVKANTNGISTRKDDMLAGLVEHLKEVTLPPQGSTSPATEEHNAG